MIPPPSRSRFHPSATLNTVAKLLGGYGLALVLILHTPLVDWFARPLFLPSAANPASADVIVLLGAWASPRGDLNEPGLRRTLRAAELYRQSIAPRIVVTGSTPANPESGSAVMAMGLLLRRLGVPETAIDLESQSENTHDSAVNVASLAKKRGWRTVALVTDAGHERRALASFRKAGLTAYPVSPPAIWDLGGEQPSARLRKLGTLLHEYGGLAYYRWRGWI